MCWLPGDRTDACSYFQSACQEALGRPSEVAGTSRRKQAQAGEYFHERLQKSRQDQREDGAW